MSPKTQALLWRTLLGLVLVEIPIITLQLQQPVFDYRLLAVGLLGAAAGYLEKNVTFHLTPDTVEPLPEPTAVLVMQPDPIAPGGVPPAVPEPPKA